MLILTSLYFTILLVAEVVEMIFEFGVCELAVFYFFSGAVGEDDFFELFAGGVEVDLLFLD